MQLLYAVGRGTDKLHHTMDTLAGMTFKELLAAKHPTAWVGAYVRQGCFRGDACTVSGGAWRPLLGPITR